MSGYYFAPDGLPPMNTQNLYNSMLRGQWQASRDPYSQTHNWPLASYGTVTQRGLVPYNNPRGFSAGQQADMYRQAMSGGVPMQFGGTGGSSGRIGAWGDIGSRYYIRCTGDGCLNDIFKHPSVVGLSKKSNYCWVLLQYLLIQSA